MPAGCACVDGGTQEVRGEVRVVTVPRDLVYRDSVRRSPNEVNGRSDLCGALRRLRQRRDYGVEMVRDAVLRRRLVQAGVTDDDDAL